MLRDAYFEVNIAPVGSKANLLIFLQGPAAAGGEGVQLSDFAPYLAFDSTSITIPEGAAGIVMQATVQQAPPNHQPAAVTVTDGSAHVLAYLPVAANISGFSVADVESIEGVRQLPIILSPLGNPVEGAGFFYTDEGVPLRFERTDSTTASSVSVYADVKKLAGGGVTSVPNFFTSGSVTVPLAVGRSECIFGFLPNASAIVNDPSGTNYQATFTVQNAGQTVTTLVRIIKP